MESTELKELRSPYGSYVLVPTSQEAFYKAKGYKNSRRKKTATTSATEDVEDTESDTPDLTDNQESGKTRKE